MCPSFCVNNDDYGLTAFTGCLWVIKVPISDTVDQGCGNTMPDLSDLVPFHSGQVENFNLLVLGKVQNLYKVNKILHFIFLLIIMSSHVALKTVWILISWLLKKPADLDLYCLQESRYLHGFISCF